MLNAIHRAWCKQFGSLKVWVLLAEFRNLFYQNLYFFIKIYIYFQKRDLYFLRRKKERFIWFYSVIFEVHCTHGQSTYRAALAMAFPLLDTNSGIDCALAWLRALHPVSSFQYKISMSSMSIAILLHELISGRFKLTTTAMHWLTNVFKYRIFKLWSHRPRFWLFHASWHAFQNKEGRIHRRMSFEPKKNTKTTGYYAS